MFAGFFNLEQSFEGDFGGCDCTNSLVVVGGDFEYVESLSAVVCNTGDYVKESIGC